MLRIKFFTCFDSLHGTYFRWHNLAIGLQQLGHEVTVHSIGARRLGRSRVEVRDGIRYVLVPATPFVSRLYDPRLDPIALFRAVSHDVGKADVFHVFQPFPHSCQPALFHRRQARCLIYDWDDYWWPGLSIAAGGFLWRNIWLPRAVRFFEQRMPGQVDGVTTCSSFLAEIARERSAVTTQIIHNGYWPDQPAPSRLAARESMGLDPEAFYFGFMGRTLGEISWCLDVFATTVSAGKKVRLALCGMHQDVVDSLPAEHRAAIDYLGNLTPAQSRVFARAIDCGLLPLEDTSFNQSRFPIKFAEYLAGGAHVVASAVGEFATLAAQLPGVTLAGKSRESWHATFTRVDLNQLMDVFETSSTSVLAQKLGWQGLARQMQDFYFSRLQKKNPGNPD